MGLEFANKFKNMGLISEETAEEARIENENMQNQNRHNKHSKNNNKKQNTNNKYVGAPYNFVPFYNDVVGVDEDNLKVHDKIRDNLEREKYAMYSIEDVFDFIISEKDAYYRDYSKSGTNIRSVDFYMIFDETYHYPKEFRPKVGWSAGWVADDGINIIIYDFEVLTE